MSIRLLWGDAAVARAEDARFVSQWSSLWQACPWATSLQLPAFVRLWYHTYRERFEPLLIEKTDGTGALTGLLPLAVPRGSRRLVGAGAEQAEYQGWLSAPAEGSSFFLECLEALHDGFRGYTLQFPFLPPGVPLDWHSGSDHWRARTELRRDQRGLMLLGDGASIEKSLRKKSNRSRLNRLERCGPLSLVSVTSADDLSRILDEIAALYDLRQGAVNGVTPFRSDPLKARFHLGLLAEAGLLHATVLKVGDAIVSAHLNLRNRDEVLLCVIAHSPRFARHSPGKLHILLLGKQLAQEGVRAFDLSPSGEYKDRFATTHEPVYSARIHLGAIPRAIGYARQAARRTLIAIGLDLRQARQVAARVASLAGGRSMRQGVRRLARAASGGLAGAPVLTFRCPRPPDGVESCGEVSCDRIADVVHFLAAEPPDGLGPHDEMRQALVRLEEGDHIFTQPGPRSLIASGWLAHRAGPMRLGGFDLDFTAPGAATVLYGFSSHHGTESPDPRAALVRTMLATARRDAPADAVIALVPRRDHSLARLLEGLGFALEPSLVSGLRRAERPRGHGETGGDDSPDDQAETSAPDKS